MISTPIPTNESCVPWFFQDPSIFSNESLPLKGFSPGPSPSFSHSRGTCFILSSQNNDPDELYCVDLPCALAVSIFQFAKNEAKSWGEFIDIDVSGKARYFFNTIKDMLESSPTFFSQPANSYPNLNDPFFCEEFDELCLELGPPLIQFDVDYFERAPWEIRCEFGQVDETCRNFYPHDLFPMEMRGEIIAKLYQIGCPVIEDPIIIDACLDSCFDSTALKNRIGVLLGLI